MILYRVDFKALPWESPMMGIRQKIHKCGSQQLRLVEFSKDLSPHWCERGHVGYVLNGQIEIKFQTDAQRYFQGDGIFIPNGYEHRHRAKVLSDTVTIIFIEDIPSVTPPAATAQER